MKDIFVSVLMTCYNREAYIAEAIESVLASTHPNFELIIVDDGSVDKSVDIVRNYIAKDNRIKLFINEKNLGDYANRNKAASYATGKYLKYCDSDDKLFPWSLEYCIYEMEKHPEAGMGILYQKKEIEKDCLLPGENIQLSFFKSTILNVGPSGTIIKTDCFKAVGGYKATYGTASDMYFNLLMAHHYPVVLLKETFFFYRMHDGQELNNRYSYICNSYRYLLDALALPEFPVTKAQKAFLLERAEYYYVKDFLVYVKNKKEVKKALKAYSVSGMNLFKMIRGGVNLSLVKLGLRKFKLPAI